jgi:hypothetical protein
MIIEEIIKYNEEFVANKGYEKYLTSKYPNNKLTGKFEDYKDHPFSWWEKKGVHLGVGTGNHVTLNTNFIHEMLILLYTDAVNLKITKLLMVTTGENRRPYISHLLWTMRKKLRN